MTHKTKQITKGNEGNKTRSTEGGSTDESQDPYYTPQALYLPSSTVAQGRQYDRGEGATAVACYSTHEARHGSRSNFSFISRMGGRTRKFSNSHGSSRVILTRPHPTRPARYDPTRQQSGRLDCSRKKTQQSREQQTEHAERPYNCS